MKPVTEDIIPAVIEAEDMIPLVTTSKATSVKETEEVLKDTKLGVISEEIIQTAIEAEDMIPMMKSIIPITNI